MGPAIPRSWCFHDFRQKCRSFPAVTRLFSLKWATPLRVLPRCHSTFLPPQGRLELAPQLPGVVSRCDQLDICRTRVCTDTRSEFETLNEPILSRFWLKAGQYVGSSNVFKKSGTMARKRESTAKKIALVREVGSILAYLANSDSKPTLHAAHFAILRDSRIPARVRRATPHQLRLR